MKDSTMSEQYNQVTATHYSAYRPPLHAMILARVLSGEEWFNQGLDVGCGTGYSAIALAKYCAHIYGIDPSQSMLEEASCHEKVSYHQGAGEAIPLPDQSVDIVTFAGSLFYAKSELLIQELKRVCRPQAWIIPYDFEVLLEDTLLQCGLKPQKIASNYDHEVNFSDRMDFIEIIQGKEQVKLEVTAGELAHILLSSTERYEAFVEKYRSADPFPLLVKELERMEKLHHLKVNIYFSKYQITRPS
jgi:SAM-dependent methyltransferase